MTTLRVFAALLMLSAALSMVVAFLRAMTGSSPLLYLVIALVLYVMGRAVAFVF